MEQFFTTLYRAHKEMERRKKELLSSISEEIDRLFYEIVKKGGIDKNDFDKRYPDLKDFLFA